MNDISSTVVAQAAGEIMGLADFYTNLAKNELTKVAAEYSDNSKERAATMELINSVKADITISGSSIKLSFSFSGNEEWLNVVEEGKGESYVGGSGGMVTNPDGSVEPSNALPQAYGQPMPDSEEPASHVTENIEKQFGMYFPQDIEAIMSSSIVADALKEEVARTISEQLGGGT